MPDWSARVWRRDGDRFYRRGIAQGAGLGGAAEGVATDDSNTFAQMSGQGPQAFDLTTGVRKGLDLTGSYNPLYYPATGHLLCGRDDVLWARPFEPVKLEFTGPEIPLTDDLGRDWLALSHQFSIANNGTLIYARGHQLDPKYRLVWVRDRGEPEVVPLPPGNYLFPRLAPDGKTVVLNRWAAPAMKTVLVNLADGQAVELGGGRFAELSNEQAVSLRPTDQSRNLATE